MGHISVNEFQAAIARINEIFERRELTSDEKNDVAKAISAAFSLGWDNAESEKKEKNRQSIARAANGRRLIGSTSRQKVKDKAMEYKHLSKEAAAAEIAEVVGLSPGHVRRYLTQLFPGDEWKK